MIHSDVSQSQGTEGSVQGRHPRAQAASRDLGKRVANTGE